MYVDDLLLYVSTPIVLLPSALLLLSHFGSFSGYKLNIRKSELFPVNEAAWTLDITNLAFKVECNKFTYLGVAVTKKHKNLLKENLVALLNEIKELLLQGSPLSMSLVGHVNSVKMVILPKLLYLFQTLTVFIPGSFFQQLDSVI